VGLCKSCVEKYKQKYMQRGFNEETARRMALKLLKRVRRRQRYEILKSIKHRFIVQLYRWTFLTQWRATFLMSFKFKRVMWVGRGYNPDYTQACTGTCTTTGCPNYAEYCDESADCRILDPTCSMGSCGCPAPLANSSQVSNSCTCQAVGYKCTTCSPTLYSCSTITFTCPCAGTCGYDCNPGYSWNGSQCVASAAWKSILGDGSSSIVNNA
jgi:hypothetical protein